MGREEERGRGGGWIRDNPLPSPLPPYPRPDHETLQRILDLWHNLLWATHWRKANDEEKRSCNRIYNSWLMGLTEEMENERVPKLLFREIAIIAFVIFMASAIALLWLCLHVYLATRGFLMFQDRLRIDLRIVRYMIALSVSHCFQYIKDKDGASFLTISLYLDLPVTSITDITS